MKLKDNDKMDIAKFNEIEEKYHLLEVNIEGYFFWIYERNNIAWIYEREMNRLQIAHNEKKEKTILRVKKKFTTLSNIIKSGRIPHVDCELLVINHPRRVLVDDAYECIYTDEFVNKHGKSVVLEKAYQGMHYQPIKTSNIMYIDWLDIKSFWYCVFCRNIFRKQYDRFRQYILKVLRDPIAELNQYYKVEVQPESLVDNIIYGIYMHHIEKKYFGRIIRKLSPKAILEVVSYSRECMVANEIAKDMGIPTIELQHGTIGQEHLAYNYPMGCSIAQFPTRLFLFSDFWKDKFQPPIKNSYKYSVGYPYLERMEQKYKPLRDKKRDKKSILFLSSGPIGDRLQYIAYQLSQLIDKNEMHIIYKLHPGEYSGWKERYPELRDSDTIEVIDNNRKNLYELYAISDIQISGYNSTTVFEGLYFSLETYILDYKVSKEICYLRDIGVVDFFKTPNELYEKIISSKKDMIDCKELLWKRNALDNISSAIMEIIG